MAVRIQYRKLYICDSYSDRNLSWKPDSLIFTRYVDSGLSVVSNQWWKIDGGVFTEVPEDEVIFTSPIPISKLQISGAPDGTKFLRDDGAWSEIGGAFDLEDINDVTITTPSTGEVLKYNGSEWVNAAESGSQDLESVLTEGNDGGAIQIKNIANPTDPQDAATKAWVEANTGSGVPPPLAHIGLWQIDTGSTSAPAGANQIRYDNGIQTSATELYIHEDALTIAASGLLGLVTNGYIKIQDAANEANYQLWLINGTPALASNSYTFPVTLEDSGGTGTTGFSDELEVRLGVLTKGGGIGGLDTQVQFNDGGFLGGDAGMTYNKTTDVLTVGGLLLSGKAATKIVATDSSKNLDTPYTFRDEDNMASNDDNGIPSQQSVKSYVDARINTGSQIFLNLNFY